MSDVNSGLPPTMSPPPPRKGPVAQRVFLVSYPKIVFMYPTMIAAFIAGLYMAFRPDGANLDKMDAHVVSSIFICLLAINLTIFSFDFPRETSLILVLAIVSVCLGAWLLFVFNPKLWPDMAHVIEKFHPVANATFYFSFGLVLLVIYGFVFINLRFDYWEVNANELIHHYGLMSDSKRFPAPNMRIDKEINDVFENILLGSGRLILHPQNEPRAIVLENIMRINQKEEKIIKLLGALKVQFQTH